MSSKNLVGRASSSIFQALETKLVAETNCRGPLRKLACPGSLEQACRFLFENCVGGPKIGRKQHLLVLTGFPCIKLSDSHGESGRSNSSNANAIAKVEITQETDGIAGALAVARAVGFENATIGIEKSAGCILRSCLDPDKEDVLPEILELPLSIASSDAESQQTEDSKDSMQKNPSLPN